MTSRTVRLAGPARTAKVQQLPLSEKGFASPEPNDAAGQVVGRGDKIIAAAFQLLNECGLEGLTVQAVLRRTRLNRRTFYEHFSGKDDLVLAVFERSLQMLAAECRAQIKTIPGSLERLRFIVAYIVLAKPTVGQDPARNFRRSAALCREHMRLAESRPKDLRMALRPLIALISEQLIAGMKSGEVREAAPERLANLVYNLVSTTVHAEVLAQEAAGKADRKHRTQLADDLWEFCRRAIST